MPNILITGPAASGKTSLAYGLLARLRDAGRPRRLLQALIGDAPTLTRITPLRPASWPTRWASPAARRRALSTAMLLRPLPPSQNCVVSTTLSSSRLPMARLRRSWPPSSTRVS